VHDGGRPLVTVELIERGRETARKTGAAVAALPLVDTIKEAGADGLVVRTVDRSRLWAAQTPQVFRYDAGSGSPRYSMSRTTRRCWRCWACLRCSRGAPEHQGDGKGHGVGAHGVRTGVGECKPSRPGNAL
jgi:hypothetical protein